MHEQLQQLMNTQAQLLDSIRHLSAKLVEVAETAMEVGQQINRLSALVDAPSDDCPDSGGEMPCPCDPPASEARPVAPHEFGVPFDNNALFPSAEQYEAIPAPDHRASSAVRSVEDPKSGKRAKNEFTARGWLEMGGLDTYFEHLKPSHGLYGLDVASRDRIREAFEKQFGASTVVGARWGSRIPAVARSIGFVVDS
jgi:hypothetical protein